MRHGPVIPQRALGLDLAAHVPVPMAKLGKFGSTRYRMPADKAGLGMVVAVGDDQRDLAEHLLTNPAHVVVHDRPHELIHYVVGPGDRIERRVHVPAFGVMLADGRPVAVDIGPDDGTGQAVVDPQVEMSYAELGVLYSVWTLSQITVRPLHPNLRLMRQIDAPHDREAILAVRGAVDHDRLPQTIGAIVADLRLPTPDYLAVADIEVDRAMSAMVRLALLGEVKFDLSVPLSRNTMVLVPYSDAGGPRWG